MEGHRKTSPVTRILSAGETSGKMPQSLLEDAELFRGYCVVDFDNRKLTGGTKILNVRKRSFDFVEIQVA